MMAFVRSFVLVTILAPLLMTSCRKEEVADIAIPHKGDISMTRKVVVKLEESTATDIEGNPDIFGVRLKSYGGSDDLEIFSIKRLFPHAGKFEERTRAEGLHRWYIVDYNPSSIRTKAADVLMEVEGVEFVEDLLHVKRTGVFNDPFGKYQWHYYNTGQLSSSHVVGADINVKPVWERYTKGNESVIVAVVDGGIDIRHEDLNSHCVGGYNFVRDDEFVVAEEHGTHVAGTISAINNNGIGVAGVAGGDAARGVKGVSLLSCQIFDTDPDTGKEMSSDGALAIKWGADHGAIISQNSWGYAFDSYNEAEAAEIPRHLKEAIDYFIKYAGIDENGEQTGLMKGGVVIFAAGNESWDVDPISEYPPVVAVGAFGPDMRRTSYSNYGNWVDIAAPGGNVRVENGGIMSTLPDNSYGFLQGTSMACPHVSGVAALIVSYFGGPGFTPDELKKRLIRGADVDDMEGQMIGPKLNALGAFTYGADVAPEKVLDFSVSADQYGVDLMWSVVADEDDGKADGYLVLMSKQESYLKDATPDEYHRSVKSYEYRTGNKKVGDVMTEQITDLAYGQTYYFTICSYDRSRNYSTMSDIVSVTTKNNAAPEIVLEKGSAEGMVIGPQDRVELRFFANDPEGHDVSFSLRQGFSTTLVSINANSMTVAIDGDGNSPGVYNLTVVAKDSEGAASNYVVSYELLENHGPIMVDSIENILIHSLDDVMEINLKDLFTDQDGEELKFYVKCSNQSIVMPSLNRGQLYLMPIDYGVATVSITAEDSYGEECQCDFKVAVKDDRKPIVLYPNPVSDYMNISVFMEDSVRFRVVSRAGAVMFEKELHLTPFADIKVDMRNLKAGIYYVIVEGDYINLSNQIVKL